MTPATLTSAIAADITAITAKASSAGNSVVSGVLTLVGGSLVSLAEDELVILGDAIVTLKTNRANGRTWEESLTACYNTFYNEEQTEAVKIATGILAAVSKVLSVVEGL